MQQLDAVQVLKELELCFYVPRAIRQPFAECIHVEQQISAFCNVHSTFQGVPNPS